MRTKSKYSANRGIKEIPDKYIDTQYYYLHRAINTIRKLFKIPFKMGDFYHSHGKDDDIERRAVDLMETEKYAASIKARQERERAGGNTQFPPECDRYTSAPCAWSKTHWSTERCRKCGHVFPEWN